MGTDLAQSLLEGGQLRRLIASRKEALEFLEELTTTPVGMGQDRAENDFPDALKRVFHASWPV